MLYGENCQNWRFSSCRSDFVYFCSNPGGNSDPGGNWCSLESTYENTNLSVDPFDAIFDRIGNPVFQNETWDGWPIKCS